MGRLIRRIALGAIAIVLFVVAAGWTIVQLRWTRTFEAPYPALAASTDPAVIDRGRRLAYGPAACAYCHLPRGDWARLDAGETPPLSGGHEFPLPFGPVYSANLTPDAATGIGRRSDGELARILRHGVRADGRAAIPLMEFHGMSDEDTVAVISFLRSQPAVRNPVPEHRLNLLGKALMAFAIAPAPAAAPPPARSPAEAPTVERGEYLVLHVASCGGCHSERGREDGALLSGGEPMDSGVDPEHLYVPPNLTPDPETGHLTGWTEETFLARFRAGPTYAGGLMPWRAYGRMSDDDLRAIWRYLRTLPPVRHATGPAVVPRGVS